MKGVIYMKIKLIINNRLEGDLYFDQFDFNLKKFVQIRKIESYDEKKWKDGSVYEFNTLKEIKEFIDSCDIDFTDEYVKEFNDYSWDEIDIHYSIDPSEDNLMRLYIESHKMCID